MSDAKHVQFKTTGDVEVVEINILRALQRLAREGELTLRWNACIFAVTSTLTLPSGAVLRSEKAPMKHDDNGWVSPVALCLLDLMDQLKASK